MNQYQAIHRATVIISSLILSALSVQNAHSDISRGCSGSIGISVDGYSKPEIFATLQGRGSCKNRLRANDCRIRAARAIERCGIDLWEKRWPNNRNPRVGQSVEACTVSRGAETVKDFRINPIYLTPATNPFDIKYAMEKAACCHVARLADSVQMTVHTASNGDEGCGATKGKIGAWASGHRWYSTKTIFSPYIANCAAVRVSGICNN